MKMKDRKEFRGLVIWLSILLFFVIGVQGTPVSIKHVKVDGFVAGKPLTEEEFNTPPKYWSPLSSYDKSYVELAKGDRLFQGDIILPPSALNAEDYAKNMARNSIINRNRLWPNATIPYLISDVYNDEERGIIASGMNEYHKSTCIRFVPRTDEDDYIQIQSISGCSSLIGRVEAGGAQPVSLDVAGCVRTDIVQHELMHAAGFHHEQSRYDRDDYVTIHWDNIEAKYAFNFFKVGSDTTQFLGTLYNYSSIMHYGTYDFAIDPSKPTITANDGSPLRGSVFSEADLLKLNRQYGCDPNDNCWDDDVRFCPELVANGTCVTDPQQMIIRCKKSCGFCRYPDCYDVDDNCHAWALQGRCEEDPDFMLANGCNRSCLTCLPQ